MSNQQRGIFQLSQENIPPFDRTHFDAEDERSRLSLLILIAFVILSMLAGVVWIAGQKYVHQGHASTAIVVETPNGPLTVEKIYDQSLPPDQEKQSSNLVQPSDQVRLEGGQFVQMAPPSVRTSHVAAASPLTEVSTARFASAAGQLALVQIGAYKSMEMANNAWTRFQARYSGIARGRDPDVQKIDLGVKGTWYRLRFGPFANKTLASVACDNLKAKGGTCMITVP